MSFGNRRGAHWYSFPLGNSLHRVNRSATPIWHFIQWLAARLEATMLGMEFAPHTASRRISLVRQGSKLGFRASQINRVFRFPSIPATANQQRNRHEYARSCLQ